MAAFTTWRKSSFSDQASCVEVAFWRTSTFSDQADCIEVGFGEVGAAVRDSKNADGPVIFLPTPIWWEFVARWK